MTPAQLLQQLQREGELRLRVKVLPKSSRCELAGFMADGTLKIKVQAPPEKGKANAEVRAVLAKELKASLRNVEIVSGHTSPLKRVRVTL